MAALKDSWQHQGEAIPAETPLSSESGGVESGCWLRGRGEVEEEGVEGSVTARCCRWADAAAGRSGPVGVAGEEGQWPA